MNDEQPVTLKPEEPQNLGDITFTIGETQLLRLCADGKIFVRGRETATDLEVVDGLREFLIAWRTAGGQNGN